ncbi:hypothetical protein [Sphingomonas sp.]|jgi:hypothetical protein|uniref:hypothetical protein n=1 Tax=Sphingomonas sp. TaxID=28214 RepID=UPI002E34724F|nr:hypothetical protein [Sphingomonas sp.]HEX4694932.1 hypothetical protein [Sphingomonas sp.]
MSEAIPGKPPLIANILVMLGAVLGATYLVVSYMARDGQPPHWAKAIIPAMLTALGISYLLWPRMAGPLLGKRLIFPRLLGAFLLLVAIVGIVSFLGPKG